MDSKELVREIDRELEIYEDYNLRNLRVDDDFWKNLKYRDQLKRLKDRIYKGLPKERLLKDTLFRACEYGQMQLIGFLLRTGSDVHARGDRNDTTLHTGARNCRRDVMELMIEEGVDLLAVNDDGETALDLNCGWAILRDEHTLYHEEYVRCGETLLRHMVLSGCRESCFVPRRPRYLSHVRYADYMSRVTSFCNRCRIELEEAIHRDVTVHDFILDPCRHIRNGELRRALRGKRLEIYGDILDAKFGEGTNRLDALRVGRIVTSHFEGLVPDTAYHLTDFLETCDIAKLKRAAIRAMDEPSRKRKPRQT